MKRFIFTFALSVTGLVSVLGQTYHTFPTNNFYWNYFTHTYDGGPCGTFENTQLFFEGDTLIGIHTYHRLFLSSQLSEQPGCSTSFSITRAHGFCDFIREDTLAKKVYRYDTASQTENLMIDFDLVLGQIHPITYFMPDTIMYVSSIDSVLLGDGEYHRRFNFSSDSFWPNCPGDTSSTAEPYSLIEGVGYTRGFPYKYFSGIPSAALSFLMNMDCPSLGPWPNELTCFGTTTQAWGHTISSWKEHLDRDLVYASSPGSLCAMYLEMELPEETVFEIYPNPAVDHVYIRVPEQTGYLHYRIVDIQGRSIEASMVTGPHDPIPVGHLPPGLYFIRLEPSGQSHTFIKY